MPSDNIFEKLNFNPDNLKSTQDKQADMQNQMAAAQKNAGIHRGRRHSWN